MINSLSVLKKISDEQGINGVTPDALAYVSELLDTGLEEVENSLLDNTSSAPLPVSEISKYILDAGGKRIRPSLCLLCAKVFSTEAMPTSLATVCELLHNATLLHDDVIDEGDVRRGKPSARMVWSNALSVLGGDYMLMRCVELVSHSDVSYMNCFVETLKALVEGEIVQLRLRGSIETSQDDYFQIVRGKTSSLFRFATITGSMNAGACGENVSQMGAFGEHIGAAFQLIDDVLDFSADVSQLGKNLLADISQGKMTLPVILASQTDSRVLDNLSQLLSGEDAAKCARNISQLVQSSGALDATRHKAEEYTAKSLASLKKVDAKNHNVVSVLEQLVQSLLARGK